MNKPLYFAMIMLSTLVYTGCNSSSSTTSTSVTGSFIDATVKGLGYTCSSGNKGTTNLNGEYTCNVEDDVTFFIGPVAIGTIAVQSRIITPYSLFHNEYTAALNLARLLQSLDISTDADLIDINTTLAASISIYTDLRADSFETDIETDLGITLVSSIDAETAMDDAITASGGSVPTDFNPHIPVADAGTDQYIKTVSLVTLDGSRSSDADADELTYAWSITYKPKRSTIVISDASDVNPTFTPDMDGAYVFSLIVSDGTVSSAADTVAITVSTENFVPIGSYKKSCKDISINDNKLLASCKTSSGEFDMTELNELQACLNSISQNGDISNINGNLICLPDLPKADPMLTFPESETTIKEWVYNANFSNIYKHGWGIWAGLTSYVGKVDGTQIRAFETWNTRSNMLSQIESGQEASPPPNLNLDLILASRFNDKNITLGDVDGNTFISVAYNPPAAKHAIDNKLFLQSTLNNYIKEGYTEIPNFPVNAMTIKPVYKIIPHNVVDGVYKFPVWPGTPSPAKAFSEEDWHSCVYVDINKMGIGGSSVDQGCNEKTDSNTFYLNNFIHEKISKADAVHLSEELKLVVSEGDYAILVGMHVTSREIKRWTWQTFWWSANPSAPYLPSSTDIANSRPLQSLDAAAQHYAMSIGYQMVTPVQPITNGKNVGASLIAFNPYLEAGFHPSVFQIVKKINGNIDNQYGVQTNCMTCHNLASYNPKTDYSIDKKANREKPYGTDYYMSITDETFDNVLKLDFAWSILAALKLDDNDSLNSSTP